MALASQPLPTSAACQIVLREAGLKTALHSYGEWDKVFAAVKHCHHVVHEMGASHHYYIKVRSDHEKTMEDKINSANEKI